MLAWYLQWPPDGIKLRVDSLDGARHGLDEHDLVYDVAADAQQTHGQPHHVDRRQHVPAYLHREHQDAHLLECV